MSVAADRGTTRALQCGDCDGLESTAPRLVSPLFSSPRASARLPIPPPVPFKTVNIPFSDALRWAPFVHLSTKGPCAHTQAVDFTLDLVLAPTQRDCLRALPVSSYIFCSYFGFYYYTSLELALPWLHGHRALVHPSSRVPGPSPSSPFHRLVVLLDVFVLFVSWCVRTITSRLGVLGRPLVVTKLSHVYKSNPSTSEMENLLFSNSPGVNPLSFAFSSRLARDLSHQAYQHLILITKVYPLSPVASNLVSDPFVVVLG